MLLLLVAGTWALGGLAIVPRMLAGKSLARRDFDAAWRWLGIAQQLSHNDPATSLLAARIAREDGDAQRMAQEIATARRNGADPAAIRREQLLALAQAGQLEDAEPELMALLLNPGPDAPAISDAYANGLAKTARFEDALHVLEAWRLDFPEDPRPDYRIGRIREHQQRFDEAEAGYRQAVKEDAGFFPARYSLGRVLLHRRKAEAAAEQFQACLAASRPEAAQVELAIALKAQGRIAEARPLLKGVLLGDPQRLRASYRALDEQPELFKAASEFGRLEADAGNFGEAEQWLRKALEFNPQDLMARYSLAVSLRSLGQAAQAEEQFARVETARKAMVEAGALNARIQRNPKDLEARLGLGKLILEHESQRSGLFWIHSILAYDPHYQPAHELLADYYSGQAKDDPQSARLAIHHRKLAESRPSP